MPNDVVDVVLQLGPAHLEFFDFLVGGEINLLLNSIDFVIEPVILIKQTAEMIVRAFQTPDDFTVFWKFSQDRVMKVHGDKLLIWVSNRCEIANGHGRPLEREELKSGGVERLVIWPAAPTLVNPDCALRFSSSRGPSCVAWRTVFILARICGQ
jgi:hypothetical protein